MPQPTPREMTMLHKMTPHARGHALQVLTRHPLLQVSSTLRSPARNRQVGGAPNSFHLRGRAVDLIGPQHDLERAAADAWTLRLGLECTGPEEVLLEYLGTTRAHLHCAW